MGSAAIDYQEQQYRECLAVMDSFEYFLDEYVYIEDKETNAPIKLTLWPAQREVIPTVLSSRLLIFLKAHQLGYTWLFVAGQALWLSITRQLHQVVINSFNEDAGKEIMDRIRFIRDRLPDWMLPPIGTDNSLYLEFKHADYSSGKPAPSTIQVIPATEKGGQGKTPNVMIFDESCFNRYVQRAYTGSLPGITQAKGKIIVISNAIKTAPGWPFTRALYTNSMKGLNEFKRVFLPWWANPNRSRKPVGDELDEKGQPLTEFKQHILNSGMDEDDFTQRYPETEAEAIATMSGSYFGRVLARHDEYLMDGSVGNLKKDQFKEIVFEEDRRGLLEVWRFPYNLVEGWDGLHWLRRYCIGSDISEGVGESYSVAYVLDRHLNEIVARMRHHRTDAHKWGTLLYWLSQWYDNALIVPERTGAGITTVKRLQDLNANLYRRTVAGKAGQPVTQEIGWTESHQAKHELCGDLKTWLGSAKTPALYDSILIDECSTYILTDTGRLEPEEGKFGDCVIGAGCTIQGDLFIGRKPETIEPPDTGWLKRWKQGELYGRQ